ncbi:MAG: M23 family metallopeptidase [Bacteroidales bacterium]|nr:M23 family metallopeptidase [Bacteroidales bacterium]
MRKHLLLFTLFFTTLEISFCQTDIFPQGYFRSPLNIPLTTSGTFAEIRNNHFHSGFDIRIGGVVGEPVYSVADGYVSRIKVSAYGGGKTLYISHPNGYKSVYMHLEKFAGPIAEYVKKYQYEHKVFEIDIEVSSDKLPVVKGQQIANAGNSGGSQGPHLHFELRHDHNDKTINPLLFGIPFHDNMSPNIHNVKVYPASEVATINGKNMPVTLLETKTNAKTKKKYTVKHDTIEVSGRFYTGIYATDPAPKSTGKNGVFDIKLYVDGKIYYHYNPREFMFEETRAVNTMIDYDYYKKTRQAYILSRVLRGNKSEVCKAFKNNGYIVFTDNLCHKLLYKVEDFHGNVSEFSFIVKSIPAEAQEKISVGNATDKYTIPIAYYLKNRYKTEGFEVYFDENTFYENDMMCYEKVAPKYKSILSDVHLLTFKNHAYPPHKTYRVKITVPDNLRNIKNKLLLVSVDGNKIVAQPFKLHNDTIEGQLRLFAGLALSIDTIAPKVSPINFTPDKVTKTKSLRIKITDNLSGITKYNCYLNDTWILAEHDGKTASLTIDVSSMIRKGKNKLKVIVSDRIGNTTTQEWNIIY